MMLALVLHRRPSKLLKLRLSDVEALEFDYTLLKAVLPASKENDWERQKEAILKMREELSHGRSA